MGKREVVHNERLSETVRREELRVDSEGDVNLSGAGSAAGVSSTNGGAWDQVMPMYRQRWQHRMGSGGGRWEDYEPGYRYGHELRNETAHHGRPWAEVEPQVERDRAQRDPSMPWSSVRHTVRETFDETTG